MRSASVCFSKPPQTAVRLPLQLLNSLGASSQHNRWSHCIFRRYTTRLPTSLICIASIDQRISSVETCCGASVRWGHRCGPRNLKDVQGAFHLPQSKSNPTITVFSLKWQVVHCWVTMHNWAGLIGIHKRDLQLGTQMSTSIAVSQQCRRITRS